MIVITDRMLREAGLTYEAAVALLDPPAEELVIHVRQELDDSAPLEPQAGDIDVPLPAGLPGETLPVIPGAAADHTSAAEPQADVARVYTPAGQIGTGPSLVGEHPAPSSTADYRGFDFRTAEAEAASQRMTLVMVGGVYTLQSVFGQRHYSSLADVMQALRLRRF